jgi:uncharacterized glyoxalase superfamily protein PhnB
MKITPLLMVEAIERSLPFWVERMGFQKTAEAPGKGRLAFVILARDGAELMLQTIESVREDEPAFAPAGPASGGSLFTVVEDFADVLKRLEGYPIVMRERTTFYGMREIGVRDPDGHIVVFAARVAAG